MTLQQAVHQPQPWKPANATDAIRCIAAGIFDFVLTNHAKEQMSDRNLITSDVLHVLKNGFVYELPEDATQPNCFKYKVESASPEGPRIVRVVVIPGTTPPMLKIVTVMWRDEATQRGS
jgi:Domain of unknown function (DUF4258)